MSPAAERDGSLLRVVRGSPTPEELAAAVAVVLSAVQGPAPAGRGGPTRAHWRRADSPAPPLVSWQAGR